MSATHVFTQGGESNFNGKWLESNVELLLRGRNVPIVDYDADKENPDLFLKTLAVRRVPYTSIYGCRSVSEFVLYEDARQRQTRIECRVQETPGSVDEKFPYLFENARDKMPESEIVLLLHCPGARIESVDWLKRKCAGIESKRIHVLDLTGFKGWLKDRLA